MTPALAQSSFLLSLASFDSVESKHSDQSTPSRGSHQGALSETCSLRPCAIHGTTAKTYVHDANTGQHTTAPKPAHLRRAVRALHEILPFHGHKTHAGVLIARRNIDIVLEILRAA